jgi:hypothetical protein
MEHTLVSITGMRRRQKDPGLVFSDIVRSVGGQKVRIVIKIFLSSRTQLYLPISSVSRARRQRPPLHSPPL